MAWPFLRFFRRKPDEDLAADEDLADITGSTIVQAIWECPTKDQCNREKAELVAHRERAAAHALKLAEENARLRTDLGYGLQEPLP